MRVLITGGTGVIGRRLVNHLIRHGDVVTVVSRQRFRPATLPGKIYFARWDGKTAEGWCQYIEKVDAVVNLAGAGLADARWSDERKKVLTDSRVNAGKAVAEAIEVAKNKPKTLIQVSAVGYYGAQKDDIITESSNAGGDFLATLCQQWEASSQAVEDMGVRRVIIRTGVVFDMKGGALPRMVLPFRLFAGGPVGSGRQWLSWIHYRDAVNAIRFLLDNESATGSVNLSAPNPLTNRDFARTLGKVMKRPALMPVPSFVLKIFFGEMSTVLLDGQRVMPERLGELGYQFEFPEAKEALADILG